MPRKARKWKDETRVTNWKELMDVYSDYFIPEPSEFTGHRRSGHLFRGMSDATWDLKTGLERLGSDPCRVEAPSLRAFSKYAPRGSFRVDSPWERLAVAQHNGLPTRLLDWTVSPLIAAHFATAELHHDVDGVVWCVDAWTARSFLPVHMRRALDERESWTYYVQLLDKKFPRLERFDQLRGDVLLFFEPPSIDDRIQNQFAVFSLLNGPHKSHDEYLKKKCAAHSNLIHRIIIDKEAKAEIRDMLDQNNVTERMLFPGLPGLCDWLRRYYAPA